MIDVQERLNEALRQYRHNTGGDELVPGYDLQMIAKLAEDLEAERKTMAAAVQQVAQEMRERKVNHGKDTSPTLHAWAGRLEAAVLPAQTEQRPTAYPHEAMDKLAADRYRVGAAGAGTLHGFAVRAGDGEQELYRGSKSDCEHVARKLAGAFLDGGFTAFERYAAPIAQTSPQQAEPVEQANPLRYKDDPRTPVELSNAGCRCVRFGEGNPHWPCSIHTAPPQDEQEEDQHDNNTR